MNVGVKKNKERKKVLEAKIPVLDKSSNPNGCEFRHAVLCIVFRRWRSFENCYKTAGGGVGRLNSEGAKIGNNRVDYNSTCSAVPKSGGGVVPTVAGWAEVLVYIS